MDEQTRYRVTGSLFLLALAIICLPMLFDAEGVPSIQIEPMPPPKPAPEVAPLEEVAPASEFIEKVDELRAQVDEDGFLTDGGTRFGEPILSEPDTGTSAWAVQLASLADQGNARELRSQLREQGYEAFISTIKSGSEVLNRVAVGPILNETDAEELRAELSQLYELDARLMAFSN